MSRENVELVKSLQPSPEVDIAYVIRDEELVAAWIDSVRAFFHSGFETALRWVDSQPTKYAGLDGLRAGWLDWLAPWVSYRTEIEHLIDAGERVLVFTRDYGRREGSVNEVKLDGAAIWTVRDGKVFHAEFYTDRAEALAAVGLEE